METLTVERFATIHNGSYTITSPSGEHRTFLIKTQKEDASFAPGQRIIALLIGPDNEADYRGFGFVTDNGVKVWRRYTNQLRDDDGVINKTDYDKFAAMVWSLATNGERSFFYEKGCRLLLEGCCIRCNRKLTHPTSILTGIGPECAKREA